MRIIYFDGVCNLCNGFVDFVIQRDTNRQFKYATLQGTSALQNLSNQDLGLDSVVLLYDGNTFKKSKAVLKIFQELNWFYKAIAIVGALLPTVLCDFLYDLVAKNRYSFFGKKKSCRLPSAAERSLFLD
jgi:predicted DCC family thiol-disulfide oxidoreductase YuxK